MEAFDEMLTSISFAEPACQQKRLSEIRHIRRRTIQRAKCHRHVTTLMSKGDKRLCRNHLRHKKTNNKDKKEKIDGGSLNKKIRKRGDDGKKLLLGNR